MKNTPKINENGTNGANGNGAIAVNPGPVRPLSELIAEAKNNNPDAKTPTTYEKPATPEPAPEASAQPEAPQEQTAPMPAPEAAPSMALIRTRSRSEEIEYQIQKSAKLQLINTQLQSLRGKLDELLKFSFSVDKDEDYRYGRLVIYDDNNREFNCKNHGLTAIVVDDLKALLQKKIEEKENELLTVSRS